MRPRVTGLERIELERMRARVGRLFAALEEAAEMVAPHAPGGWLPPVDVCETCEEVVVQVELPGVRADAVEVTLTNSHLHVAGRKRKGVQRGVTSHLCTERFYGEFARAVPLRWPVRAQDATAQLRDGLLVVRLPKLKERRGREFKIAVSAGGE
ncbi:MAG TPA: Hsp20/alpha crystallin family protein [Pyrinomonadaceae bacterium]|nr:Hsp20/alpha crystallin family protein [Pyrinomonadaceae bacterium]